MYRTKPRSCFSLATRANDKVAERGTLGKNWFASFLLLCIILLSLSAGVFGQVSVTTQHNNVNRTGATPDETILNSSNVNVDTFGKLFSLDVDGMIYAQPLYVSNLPISGVGTRNV